MTAPPRITVVVLSYNSAKWVKGCLDALARSQGVELEVIHVDNASSDGSHEIASEHPACAKALRSERNLGCAGGNELGWRSGTFPYVAFINPDCRVMPETLAELVRPLERPEVGVTGARLLYPNSRTVQHAGGILHPNAMCEHIGVNQQDSAEFDGEREVDYVTGALMAFRREDLESTGGFDLEYFPAYYEETDLIWRVRKLGRKVLYVGSAIAYHHETAGLVKHSARFVRTSYRGRIRFLLKNYSLGKLMTVFLPFEWKWFWGPYAKGFRGAVLRSYLSGAGFALRCICRGSRRPRNLRAP